MTPAETIATEFTDKLKEAGVSHFVVAYCDPDDNSDYLGVFGSTFWRSGLGRVLVDHARHGPTEGSDEVAE